MGCGPSNLNEDQTKILQGVDVPEEQIQFSTEADESIDQTNISSEEDEQIDDMESEFDEEDEPNNGNCLSAYTVDDIVEHNERVALKNHWFRFGPKVYCVDKLIPTLQEEWLPMFEDEAYTKYTNCETCNTKYLPWNLRCAILCEDNEAIKDAMEDFIEEFCTQTFLTYPVHHIQTHGINRKYIDQALLSCEIGIFIELERSTLLSRMYTWVFEILKTISEMDIPEYTTAYQEQLHRWLFIYPDVTIENVTPDQNVDPNTNAFPIASSVFRTSLIFQNWLEDWEKFDTKVEGEAAWGVIDLDIIKNDVTTQEQEEIWKRRNARKNFGNRVWMKHRRYQIAKSFVARHGMEPKQVKQYLTCCDNLTASWKTFTELLES